jgi:hypothetical protein
LIKLSALGEENLRKKGKRSSSQDVVKKIIPMTSYKEVTPAVRMSFYNIHLVTFYEDDLLLFFQE